MAFEFRLPELGEGIEDAEVAEVLVKEGDRIEAEQSVAELETEKAVIELPAPRAGVVAKVHIAPGQTLKVGDVVLTIDEGGANGEKDASEELSAESSAGEETSAEEQSGEPAQAQPAEAAPVADRAVAATGDEDSLTPPPPAGPATRRLARKLGVDLTQVRGSGSNGRITPEDVEQFVHGRMQSGGAGLAATPALPDFSQFGPVERQRLSKLNRTAAEQLGTSWRLIPHVTQHELADVTELESVRKRYMQTVGKDGPKITVTAIVLKACVQLLSETPQFNSSLDAAAGELVVKGYYHIGVAVDTEHGLVVPVVRDADEKSILEIAAELTDLSAKARERKLELSQMQGASFTITNLGGIGGTAFTPIVNHPEVAILGLSQSRPQPAYVDGQLQERLMLPLSLSYDHRVINGADAARFVVRLSALLAQPFGLLANI